jgi:hypothetical protein
MAADASPLCLVARIVESSARAQPSLSPKRRTTKLSAWSDPQVTPRARSIHARRDVLIVEFGAESLFSAIYVGRRFSIHLPGCVSTMMEHNGGFARRHLSRAELLG